MKCHKKSNRISVLLFLILFCFSLTATAAVKNRYKPHRYNKLKINIRDQKFRNIEFDSNKSSIRKSSYGELDHLISLLQDNSVSVKVAGYADSRGTYLYNWKLSKDRAESVRDYIAAKGYDKSRIAAVEFGDTKPIATNKTPKGRQLNRRVEISIY